MRLATPFLVIGKVDFARSNLFALADGFCGQNASLVTETNLQCKGYLRYELAINVPLPKGFQVTCAKVAYELSYQIHTYEVSAHEKRNSGRAIYPDQLCNLAVIHGCKRIDVLQSLNRSQKLV